MTEDEIKATWTPRSYWFASDDVFRLEELEAEEQLQSAVGEWQA